MSLTQDERADVISMVRKEGTRSFMSQCLEAAQICVQIETVAILKSPALTLIGMMKMRAEQLASRAEEEAELEAYLATFDDYHADPDFGSF